ncbi:hypothetical protein JKP88DRAFT_247994 [Tribonema minus]|uniref:Uncharacterized protein n=1 Tax=Tribonema minus TaxID=303371 RepID=A0A835YNQ7_9STRA|nr:hypothetical protein JKP88DRAFT_247994 [Tribonema minus]
MQCVDALSAALSAAAVCTWHRQGCHACKPSGHSIDALAALTAERCCRLANALPTPPLMRLLLVRASRSAECTARLPVHINPNSRGGCARASRVRVCGHSNDSLSALPVEQFCRLANAWQALLTQHNALRITEVPVVAYIKMRLRPLLLSAADALHVPRSALPGALMPFSVSRSAEHCCGAILHPIADPNPDVLLNDTFHACHAERCCHLAKSPASGADAVERIKKCRALLRHAWHCTQHCPQGGRRAQHRAAHRRHQADGDQVRGIRCRDSRRGREAAAGGGHADHLPPRRRRRQPGRFAASQAAVPDNGPRRRPASPPLVPCLGRLPRKGAQAAAGGACLCAAGGARSEAARRPGGGAPRGAEVRVDMVQLELMRLLAKQREMRQAGVGAQLDAAQHGSRGGKQAAAAVNALLDHSTARFPGTGSTDLPAAYMDADAWLTRGDTLAIFHAMAAKMRQLSSTWCSNEQDQLEMVFPVLCCCEDIERRQGERPSEHRKRVKLLWRAVSYCNSSGAHVHNGGHRHRGAHADRLSAGSPSSMMHAIRLQRECASRDFKRCANIIIRDACLADRLSAGSPSSMMHAIRLQRECASRDFKRCANIIIRDACLVGCSCFRTGWSAVVIEKTADRTGVEATSTFARLGPACR